MQPILQLRTFILAEEYTKAIQRKPYSIMPSIDQAVVVIAKLKVYGVTIAKKLPIPLNSTKERQLRFTKPVLVALLSSLLFLPLFHSFTSLNLPFRSIRKAFLSTVNGNRR